MQEVVTRIERIRSATRNTLLFPDTESLFTSQQSDIKRALDGITSTLRLEIVDVKSIKGQLDTDNNLWQRDPKTSKWRKFDRKRGTYSTTQLTDAQLRMKLPKPLGESTGSQFPPVSEAPSAKPPTPPKSAVPVSKPTVPSTPVTPPATVKQPVTEQPLKPAKPPQQIKMSPGDKVVYEYDKKIWSTGVYVGPAMEEGGLFSVQWDRASAQEPITVFNQDVRPATQEESAFINTLKSVAPGGLQDLRSKDQLLQAYNSNYSYYFDKFVHWLRNSVSLLKEGREALEAYTEDEKKTYPMTLTLNKVKTTRSSEGWARIPGRSKDVVFRTQQEIEDFWLRREIEQVAEIEEAGGTVKLALEVPVATMKAYWKRYGRDGDDSTVEMDTRTLRAEHDKMKGKMEAKKIKPDVSVKPPIEEERQSENGILVRLTTGNGKFYLPLQEKPMVDSFGALSKLLHLKGGKYVGKAASDTETYVVKMPPEFVKWVYDNYGYLPDHGNGPLILKQKDDIAKAMRSMSKEDMGKQPILVGITTIDPKEFYELTKTNPDFRLSKNVAYTFTRLLKGKAANDQKWKAFLDAHLELLRLSGQPGRGYDASAARLVLSSKTKYYLGVLLKIANMVGVSVSSDVVAITKSVLPANSKDMAAWKQKLSS